MNDIVAVVTDLYFGSRISAAAQKAGRTVDLIQSPEQAAAIGAPSLVLVDLDAYLDVESVIRLIRERCRAPIVAFGPHLDTAKRKAARAAGADRVLAKSKFVTELPRMMERQQTSGGTELDAALAELRTYADRMTELAGLLRDPASAGRIYFAPDPHMEVAKAGGDAIILDAADYLGFLAVAALRPKLERVRELGGAKGGSTSAGAG